MDDVPKNQIKPNQTELDSALNDWKRVDTP